jgi:hypothetical protein
VILSEEEFEKFCAYGFSIEYPTVCYIEFRPKSKREAGDVIFHYSPNVKIYLTWGDLEKARKIFPTVEEQAEHSVDVMVKSRRVRNVERVKEDLLTICMHRAVFNHIRLDEVPRGYIFGQENIKHEAYSVHLHCENTSRFFVIYSLLAGPPKNFPSIMMSMINSFKCH